jgi:ligand-binding SRPBCC domain-containing protein
LRLFYCNTNDGFVLKYIPMKRLVVEQFLPLSLEDAWSFFSSPKNLNAITPPEMSFQILHEIPEKMYEGLIINYIVSPMFNIPMKWVTEITHVKENHYFVDEQRLGPYQIWHHEHHFKVVKGGVLMTDILHYHIGKSIFGWLAGLLFVDKKVASIFKYRGLKLEQLEAEGHFNK